MDMPPNQTPDPYANSDFIEGVGFQFEPRKSYKTEHLLMQRKIALRALRQQHKEDWENRLLPRLDTQLNWRDAIQIKPGRNSLLTEQGRETLLDRYLSRDSGETDPQHMFARVAAAGADDAAHAQRLYDYFSQHWAMPATPVLTNLGTNRGLPISCFINSVEDSLTGIMSTWTESSWMGARGGGVGTYWGYVRELGAPIADNGVTSGMIPFVRVSDSLSVAINQGGVRRGSAACYLDISHPEIEEFLHLRDPSGDYNRRALNLHHGIVITDAFMHAVRNDLEWVLTSPKDGAPRGSHSARQLFSRIVEMRLKTGEPYLLFIDTVNRAMPAHQQQLGLKVTTSNLCSEITLPTGRDHLGKQRSAVCCLASLNLVHWEAYKDNQQFFEDVLRFLDNVLTDFILRAPEPLARAVYSAWRERSVGLGVMGFHTMLQQRSVAFESAVAKAINLQVFKKIREHADTASRNLALERGACPDAEDAGYMERFSCKLAIAPTASISTIAGGVSPCIEPIPANVFNHKTLTGNHAIYNKELKRHLAEAGLDTEETWSSIIENGGSVQHLEELPQATRAIFKTAFEIDPRFLIDFAADRAPFIDQAQSLNLYVEPTIDKFELAMIHYEAWAKGIKSVYYLRSRSIQRAGNLFVAPAAGVEGDNTLAKPMIMPADDERYLSCASCE